MPPARIAAPRPNSSMTDRYSSAADATQVDMPSEVALSGARDRLRLTWPDGSVSEIAAQRLREASRSAGAVRARLDGAAAAAPADIRVDRVRPVGLYAINVLFSDGHDRGIYPWALLRCLGRAEGGST